MTTPTLQIDVHLTGADLRRELAGDVREGLGRFPKELPPRWFYDERGSRLFDEITRLPEYYLTRREREILAARAPEVAALTGAETLVELGSGTSEKTRLLLDALREEGRLRRFVPVDVSEPTLRVAAEAVAAEYPGLEVHAVVGDLERHLELLPPGGTRLVAFLGSTIGNLLPAERARFLAGLRGALAPGEWLLVGADLVKDEARLLAAYDDAAGVTAEFNRNVLAVINRELRGEFDLGAFDHVARWDAEGERIELLLRSRRDQRVPVRDLGIEPEFAAGEEMRTEWSAKFRRETVEAELAEAGFTPVRWWADGAGDFGVALARAGAEGSDGW
ncbi:MAG TPA: L-histidine N(alpha)-methyltransferase [Gaiellaceae bacterium]|nr:L-histidine N(alpha)-methyltransferase [Gaiellaceae bacterium]